jgi:hypothetical protein
LIVVTRGNIVVDRQYFVRQAATLLKFAQSSSEPQVVAGLVDKADLKSHVDEMMPPPDKSYQAPDVQRPV